ncbi:hypothetical protein [Bradyrhizobium lablabi]|nr:hypothetical protein [Bradyrhizobium lablabi]
MTTPILFLRLDFCVDGKLPRHRLERALLTGALIPADSGGPKSSMMI